MLRYIVKNFSSSVACFVVTCMGMLLIIVGFYTGCVLHGLSSDENYQGGEPKNSKRKLDDEYKKL
jgi:hypothetical protein